MANGFFDCNCAVGRMAVPQPGSYATVAELLDELRYGGISQAMVYHTVARDHAPMIGNRQLLDEIAGSPELTPCWVVMPHHTGEVSPPDQLVDEMRQSGVRAARIFPASKDQMWSVSDWSAGPLFAGLAAARVPLFIDFDQIGWDAIHRIAGANPALPLVVTGVRYEEFRNLYPLLAQLPNLHVDTSWLVVHQGLEELVTRFGSERFLFGSRMPIFSPGPAMTHLLYADISESARSMIAGDNLRRLLSW